MSMQDPIADMLTRIRNAHHRSHPEVTMPASKLKASVAKVLQDEGYIASFSVSEEVKPSLTIELKYFEGRPVIEEIARIEFQFEGDAELNAGEGLNFHFALPLQTIAATRSGQIDISVTIDEAPAGLLSFWMQDASENA